jgi:hypothetical protein
LRNLEVEVNKAENKRFPDGWRGVGEKLKLIKDNFLP